MTRSELTNVLTAIGVKPSRKLGQNFLIDTNMLEAMVRAAAPQAGERILEIGPGTGIMTLRLLRAGTYLTAIEYDHRLAEYLRQRFAGSASFTLLEADACAVDYQQVMGEVPYRCIANLPYAVSSILISRLANHANPPREMYILLQREMAQRLCASPRSKPYGALTVQVQSLYEARILRKLPRHVFYPPPEVDSAFLRLVLRPDPPTHAAGRELFVQMVREAFEHRRKKLTSTLGTRYGRSTLGRALEEIGAAAGARAEELSPDQFVDLGNRLIPRNPPGHE